MADKLSDRDIAADLLSGAKQLSTGYHDEYVQSTKELFDYMHNKGWHNVKPVTGPMGESPRS
ncbi:MAG: spore coat protein [Firmicutes bacterium]|nr:spore coat protein [Bacillota bacterium]